MRPPDHCDIIVTLRNRNYFFLSRDLDSSYVAVTSLFYHPMVIDFFPNRPAVIVVMLDLHGYALADTDLSFLQLTVLTQLMISCDVHHGQL